MQIVYTGQAIKDCSAQADLKISDRGGSMIVT